MHLILFTLYIKSDLKSQKFPVKKASICYMLQNLAFNENMKTREMNLIGIIEKFLKTQFLWKFSQIISMDTQISVEMAVAIKINEKKDSNFFREIII